MGKMVRMGEHIRLTAADGFEFGAYRADPDGPPRGAVVVIGEVWGVNHWVRSVADLYAENGYLAIAPAMFDRIEPGFESENYGPDHWEKVRSVMKQFEVDKALTDVAATVRAATEGGKVGITGFCFGGMITWRAASAGLGLSAASGYYGGGVPRYIDLDPVIPLEMHYGARDRGIPLEQIEDLRRRHPDVDVYTYDAGHGFCNSDSDRYDEAASQAATARSLEFFARHLA